MTSYAELEVATNFTFLAGGSHPEELVATAKALGLDAIAVTDRNTLAGVVRAHIAAKEAGIKFIVGARLDLQDAPSLLAYPADRAAYGRLCRLLTLGQRRAEKGQCTLYLDDVAGDAEGLIFIVLPPDELDWIRHDRATDAIPPLDGEGGSAKGRAGENPAPACGILSLPSKGRVARPKAEPGGVILRETSPHPARKARRPPHEGEVWSVPISSPRGGLELVALGFESQLRRIKQALGASTRVYLAARHSYRGDDRARIAALAELGRRAGIPLVATNAVLYHAPHRRALQDVLTCIREKCTIAEAGLRLEANAERHIKSAKEMARLFTGYEDALHRSVEIARACAFSLDELKYEYPDEPVPEGKTPQSHLEDLTWEGASWRYPDGLPDKVRDTLNKELALIAELNYAPYFLTVHDIVHYARSQGILCQGRGSAANSAVCYCLAITNVDPTEIDLLFERFVSPERKEPPDIDVDFEHERREEVIQYIYARYGRDRAGLAATVICYRGRLAVREVGKALGLSADTVAALATTIWGLSNSSLPEQYVRQAGLDPSDPLLSRVLELTQELIGFPRHLSQHVGGFVLTRGPLSEVVPIGNAAMEDRTVIEWDKDDLDALGLLKVDVLGLGMLTCIRKAFALLKVHYGKDVALGTVPRDDPRVYDMLCGADSIGVFQVESRAQMNMLPRLKPRCFYDLVIEVAIVRPGPIQGDMVHPYLRRRCGEEPVLFPSPHPDHGPPDELYQVLGKTLGVPLFQEQAMRLAMVAAKFSGPEANELRRAMATFRRRGTIDRLKEKMVGRMTARGYPADFAERCFNQIKGFGEYGFPESHAASFAHLVYVSSWLKCHYPAAFAAALLNSQPMGFYAPAQIVACARAHGVEAREADINASLWDCTLELSSPGLPAFAEAKPPLGGVLMQQAPRLRAGRTGRSSNHQPLDNEDQRLLDARLLGHDNSVEPLPSSFALRLGLRQIDGLREDDAMRLVSIRDGVPPELLPHLFAPPPVELRHTGESRYPELQAQCMPLLDSGFRRNDGLLSGAESVIPPLDGEGGSAEGRAGWGDTIGESPPPGLLRKPTSPRGGGLVAPSAKETDFHARGRETFSDVRDLWRRSGLKRASLERLAAADTFRSLGLDRRQALWEVRGLPREVPLPLFEHANAAEAGAEQEVALPLMPLSEHVVNDYRTLRLSLKAHPMSFLRARIAAARIAACADLKKCRDGARVSVAGVVLVRQRPGSAQGVVFMTIEDETGIANSVIWPNVLERERKAVMGARLVVVHGRVQRHEDIIHVVATRLEDRSDWLHLLTEDGEAVSLALANADEVRRPERGSWRPPPDVKPCFFPPLNGEGGSAEGRAGWGDPSKTPPTRRATRSSSEAIAQKQSGAPTSPPGGGMEHVAPPARPRWHPRRHPRAERIIPKSRDFH